MAMAELLYISESVAEAPTDKMCDQISDAILDALIAEDPESRVAVESLATTGLIVVAAEVTSKARPDFVKIAREVSRGIGYEHADLGFNGNKCTLITAIQPIDSLDLKRPSTPTGGNHHLPCGRNARKQRWLGSTWPMRSEPH